MTVLENTNAPRSTGPVVAATEPLPPAPVLAPPAPPPKLEEPVTEASANAAYLKNPPPEYPLFAQRQGWQGTVLLRVHVLAQRPTGQCGDRTVEWPQDAR
jgi:protein TonB